MLQVKRIHEYKRQLLNVFGIIHRYTEIKAMTAAEKKEVVPRVVVIGALCACRLRQLPSSLSVDAEGDIKHSTQAKQRRCSLHLQAAKQHQAPTWQSASISQCSSTDWLFHVHVTWLARF